MTPQEIAIAALEEAGHEDDPVDIAVTYKIALEQIAKGGWIPVEERPPRISQSVLASIHGQCGEYVTLLSYRGYGIWCDVVGRTDVTITAWMPLPEAYKEATDETD